MGWRLRDGVQHACGHRRGVRAQNVLVRLCAPHAPSAASASLPAPLHSPCACLQPDSAARLAGAVGVGVGVGESLSRRSASRGRRIPCCRAPRARAWPPRAPRSPPARCASPREPSGRRCRARRAPGAAQPPTPPAASATSAGAALGLVGARCLARRGGPTQGAARQRASPGESERRAEKGACKAGAQHGGCGQSRV